MPSDLCNPYIHSATALCDYRYYIIIQEATRSIMRTNRELFACISVKDGWNNGTTKYFSGVICTKVYDTFLNM